MAGRAFPEGMEVSEDLESEEPSDGPVEVPEARIGEMPPRVTRVALGERQRRDIAGAWAATSASRAVAQAVNASIAPELRTALSATSRLAHQGVEVSALRAARENAWSSWSRNLPALTGSNLGSFKELFGTTLLQRHLGELSERLGSRSVASSVGAQFQASISKQFADVTGIKSLTQDAAGLAALRMPTVRLSQQLAMRPRMGDLFGSAEWERTVQAVQLFDSRRAVVDVATWRTSALQVAGLEESVARYWRVQGLVGALRSDSALRGQSFGAAMRANRYLDGLPTKPLPRRAWAAGLAVDGTAGLVVGEALLADSLTAASVEEVAADAESVIFDSWRSGSAALRGELCTALRSLDPLLPDLLAGAWDDVERAGSAAASKVAHCLVELLDQTLRAAAPDEDITAWFARESPDSSYVHDGEPTRRARVAFILRGRSVRDRQLVLAQEGAIAAQLTPLMGSLQQGKHGPPVSMTQARAYAYSVETLLCQLLLSP